MVEAAFIVPLLPVPQTGWRLLDHYYLRGQCYACLIRSVDKTIKGLAWRSLGPGNDIVHAGSWVEGTFGENETVAIEIEQTDFSGIPGCIDGSFDDAAFGLPRSFCEGGERVPVILELEVQRHS